MNGYSVLILDDEEFFVDVLIEDTDWKGCGISQVHGVHSVSEAKAFLRRNSVQILLCDVEMPGENGLALVEWVMEYVRFSGEAMVCIMLTCHPEYGFLRKAMQLGCQDYLLKPVDTEDLQSSLRKAVASLEEQRLRQKPMPEQEVDSGRELIRRKILPYIETHLTESFTVTELADSVGLNAQYMMRLFKKETGMSVLEYVTGKKIVRAKELLLSTDRPVEQISGELGYYNYSYFFKVFKRQEGKSPAQYRKDFKK